MFQTVKKFPLIDGNFCRLSTGMYTNRLTLFQLAITTNLTMLPSASIFYTMSPSIIAKSSIANGKSFGFIENTFFLYPYNTKARSDNVSKKWMADELFKSTSFYMIKLMLRVRGEDYICCRGAIISFKMQTLSLFLPSPWGKKFSSTVPTYVPL